MRRSELKKKREKGAQRMLRRALVLASDYRSHETAHMYHRCLVGGDLSQAEEARARYELSLLCVPTSPRPCLLKLYKNLYMTITQCTLALALTFKPHSYQRW